MNPRNAVKPDRGGTQVAGRDGGRDRNSEAGAHLRPECHDRVCEPEALPREQEGQGECRDRDGFRARSR